MIGLLFGVFSSYLPVARLYAGFRVAKVVCGFLGLLERNAFEDYIEKKFLALFQLVQKVSKERCYLLV